jgi:hypothetical protein
MAVLTNRASGAPLLARSGPDHRRITSALARTQRGLLDRAVVSRRG